MDVTEQDLDAEEIYLRGRKYINTAQTKARYKVKAETDEHQINKDRARLIREKALNMEQVVTWEYEAWRLKTMGLKVHEIAHELKTTQTQVTVWLQDAMAQIRAVTKGLIDLDREIELSRTEELLKHHMPLALMAKVMIEKIRKGEPVCVEDFEQPQRHAWIVIELIKLRCKILGLVMPQTEQSMMPAMDVFGWLRTQHEFIKSAVKDAPRDVLTLETDEPIDKPKTTDQRSTQGVPDAV
jgi:hypothetical protein